jgi:hypothetical protein
MKSNHLLLGIWGRTLLFTVLTIQISHAQSEFSGNRKNDEGKEIHWWTFDNEIEKNIPRVNDWNIGPTTIVNRDNLPAKPESGDFVLDAVQQKQDSLYGNFKYVSGVHGKAIKLDGFRTYIRRNRYSSTIPKGPFTVESWIALASYPWSWSPVIDCSYKEINGFFLGIDREGHAGFKIAAGSSWYEITTMESIPLRKWTLIAAVFEPGEKISLFINGKEAAAIKIQGNYVPTRNGTLTIGRNNKSQTWNDFVFAVTSKNTYFFLDGLLDEIKITGKAKTQDELKKELNALTGLPDPALSNREHFPVGPAGSGTFGAFYSRLNYYEEWDDLWREGDASDLYVRFDQSPVQLVFWRGTGFVPCWISENNIWYTNEWLETWGKDVVGCAEPLMDRQCRFSHVRIIENTDARVVIHWRYALADAFYNFAAIGDDGRGEWCDEYYTIYPDMASVRKMELHYSRPIRNHDWLEQIVLMPPGKVPDDVIEEQAMSLVNMSGDIQKYSWHDENLKLNLFEPKGANISVVNLKSAYRPFIMVFPDPVEVAQGIWESPFYQVISPKFLGGSRIDPLPSVYGWWNHWPVAQVPGDGRWVSTADRPSHFSLGKFSWWKDYQFTENTRTRIMLHGMTDKKGEELAVLARSWLQAPEINIISESYTGGLYDQSERAYILENTHPDHLTPCEFIIKANVDSPAVNPAIIIKNWAGKLPKLSMNGREVPQGMEFRQGIRKGVYGNDLIVWIQLTSTEPVKVRLE